MLKHNHGKIAKTFELKLFLRIHILQDSNHQTKEFIAQFLAYNINHEQVAVKILKAEKNNQFS